MRKSSLIFLLAMAFVMTTVVAAFSAESICKRCDAAKNLGGWSYGLQIDYVTCDPEADQGPYCPCPTFDYELGSAQSGMDFCGGGYCVPQSVFGVLMELCDCEAVANGEVDPAEPYALRLTIMSPASGVYWTDRNFSNPLNDVHSCSVDCDGVDLATAEGDQYVYVASHEVSDPALPEEYCVTSCPATAGNFALTYISATPGQVLASQACNRDCCMTCDNNKVTAITTCDAVFLTNNNPLLLIDMPEFVWDPTDINVSVGTKVEVKIELIGECGGLCTSSKVYCECLIDVGTFTECTAPTYCQLCLPYLVGEGVGTWWTGIALTNATSSDADVTITYVADGVSVNQVLTVSARTVKSFMLDSVDLAALPALAPIYAQLTSSAPINAFVMVGDNDQAQGYLGLCGSCGCGAASGCYH